MLVVVLVAPRYKSQHTNSWTNYDTIRFQVLGSSSIEAVVLYYFSQIRNILFIITNSSHR